MHALRVTWSFLRIGVQNDMQYRANFYVQILQSVIQIATGLIGLWVIFLHTGTLAGWTKYQLLAVMGVYTAMNGIIQTLIQPNMTQLMQDVQMGTLDYALTKPVDAQLIVSVRQIEIWQLVDVLSGVAIVLISVLHLQGAMGVVPALAFLVMLIAGGLMVYSFWLILTTIAFWVVRMDQIVEMFSGVYNAGRYPVTVYPEWLKLGLTFLVPIAFAVTVPAEALTGRLTAGTVLLALVLAAAFLIAARWFWRLGIRRYAGASA